MSVEVREVSTPKERRLFIYFPERLYEKRYPQWVHPIYKGQHEFFNPRKHNAWNFSDAALFLAWRSGKVVGRVMSIINHRLNEFHNIKEARFGYFDCIDDGEVARALLSAARNWVRERGYTYIVGPLGFANTDLQGMLVEGFEERASVGDAWHPPYTHKLVEAAGFRKEVDWVTYYVDFTCLPAVYAKIARRVLSRNRYRLVEFAHRREFKPWIKPVFVLMNEAYGSLHGFSPLTDAEIDKVVRDYLPILDPRFGKLITLDEEVVAFAVGVPDVSAGIRAARGRLFPFGIFSVLRARKRSRRLDMILGAIKQGHRGRGLDVVMANALYVSARKAGITHADSHNELESNTAMRGEMEKAGGRIYKRHRLYRKELN